MASSLSLVVRRHVHAPCQFIRDLLRLLEVVAVDDGRRTSGVDDYTRRVQMFSHLGFQPFERHDGSYGLRVYPLPGWELYEFHFVSLVIAA